MNAKVQITLIKSFFFDLLECLHNDSLDFFDIFSTNSYLQFISKNS